MGELLFGGFMGIFMLFFIISSRGITDMGGADPIGPAGFPILIAGMGLVLLGAIAVQGYRRKKEKGAPEGTTGLSPAAILTTLLLVFYVPGLNYLGFMLCSFLLLSSLVFIFGCGSFGKSLLVGLLGTGAAVLLFGCILHVALPRGMWLFKILSYHVY